MIWHKNLLYRKQKIILVLFLIVASVISWIDWRRQLIPDRIILPAIAAMGALMYLGGTLGWSGLAGAGIVAVLFAIPVMMGIGFGGGDIRFGIFCALFVGLKGIGWFVLAAALVHLLLLALHRRKSAGFAPAMSAGALLSYGVLA